jgi:hypothetical protein
VDKLWADLKWLAFQTKYCLGGDNLFESKICRDFRPWAIGATVLVSLIVIYFVWSWAAKKARAWLWRRAQAKVADKETMDRVRWTGYDPKK